MADHTSLVGLRRNPFGGALDAGTPESVRLRGVAERTLLELRIGRAQDRSRMDPEPESAAVRSALAMDLPAAGRAVDDAGRLAVWLGPGWWLLDVPEGSGHGEGSDDAVGDADGAAAALEAPLVHRLRALSGRMSAVDVSAGYAVLDLTGPRAPDVLAHGCSIDLHPREFGPGRAARTMLAKAQVVLAQTDGAEPASAPTYRIWVRTSFAGYLVAWLLDAATEYLDDDDVRAARDPRSARAGSLGG